MRLFALLFFIASFAVSANAADSTNGGLLHAEKCTSCHESAVYIRENRIVQSLSGLGTQVRFCKDNLGVAWFDDEVGDVIGYLNKNYYHF
jgi:hypothetical protein